MINLYDHFRDISKEVVDIAKDTLEIACIANNFAPPNIVVRAEFFDDTKQTHEINVKELSVDQVTKPMHSKGT